MARWFGSLFGRALGALTAFTCLPCPAQPAPRIAAGDVALDAESPRSPRPVLARGPRELADAAELLERGFVEAARAALLSVAARREHPHFRAALPWLAIVAGRLSDPADLADAFGRYTDAEIETVRSARDAELYFTARYLWARAAYAGGRYRDAIASLSKVRAGSRYAVEAHWFTAASHVRLRRSVPAIHALRALLRSLDTTRRADAAEWRDLANLSLARIYHAAAVRLDPATNAPIVDPRRLTLAVLHWDRVDVFGRHGQDALYERATAYHLAGNVAHALGDIHSVLSPHYRLAHPEAELLKAAFYFGMCDYDGAYTLLARLIARVSPVLRDLEAFLRDHEGDRLAAFAIELEAGRRRIQAVLEPLFERALAQPRLRRRLEDVRRLRAEERLLHRSAASFRASRSGTQVLAVLGAARRASELRAGDELRSWLETARSRMAEALRDTQPFFMSPAGYNFGGGLSNEFARVVADEEYVLWPFDGEYWKDELGSYRQIPHSRCVSLGL